MTLPRFIRWGSRILRWAKHSKRLIALTGLLMRPRTWPSAILPRRKPTKTLAWQSKPLPAMTKPLP